MTVAISSRGSFVSCRGSSSEVPVMCGNQKAAVHRLLRSRASDGDSSGGRLGFTQKLRTMFLICWCGFQILCGERYPAASPKPRGSDLDNIIVVKVKKRKNGKDEVVQEKPQRVIPARVSRGQHRPHFHQQPLLKDYRMLPDGAHLTTSKTVERFLNSVSFIKQKKRIRKPDIVACESVILLSLIQLVCVSQGF